jgi:DNA-binding IclR family transcriptional regulator
VPIDIEEFEQSSGTDDIGTTNAERILRFLATNDDKAFTRAEIADATALDADVVSSVLNRLKDRNLVRHRRPYWAIGDRQRLDAATDLKRSIETFDDRLGEEAMDEWRAAGGDEPPADR